MNKGKKTYTGKDLAFIIPTKDRPEKVRNLLQSIAKQGMPCGRIILVDGGSSIKSIVEAFSDRLPVEYYRCDPPGQIRQRNMGIALLDGSTPLVGFLDDDIVLVDGALLEMIAFWNRVGPNTAGVSFNIVSDHSSFPSWAKAVVKRILPRQGKVLSSGYHVSIENVDAHIKSQWLCGGATVWRQDILKEYRNREIPSQWAIGEDVMFSYPVGKAFPLYVCADAKVRHEHVYDHNVKRKHRYYGRTVILWRFFFVESYPELSRSAFLMMMSTEIAMRVLIGLISMRKQDLQFALGQIEGALAGLRATWGGKKLIHLLDDAN
ncbi:MAG: glycosyltransferase family 2 protein [Deltaproteobacteria bacterium]|nr:glycosyltransferase family 2 protein [Deltaproteobacteria bacterium]